MVLGENEGWEIDSLCNSRTCQLKPSFSCEIPFSNMLLLYMPLSLSNLMIKNEKKNMKANLMKSKIIPL